MVLLLQPMEEKEIYQKLCFWWSERSGPRRHLMILCSGVGDENISPSEKGILWTQRTLTSEEPEDPVPASTVLLQKTYH